ncbi:MAG TPA: ISL3 family transposase [Clostridiales bacterium]|nr:ISL3 family transposase [Clostridiales bacterium]
MLHYHHYIEKLIGFKDIILTDVENDTTRMDIYLEMRPKAHNCPCCHQLTDKVHDYRIQIIKDIPTFGMSTFIHYRKRRYVCKRCQKRFYEKSLIMPRYYRMSSRLIQYVVTQMRSPHSVTSIAKACNLSVPTVFRVFRHINYPPSKLPKVLSIDEFKGNAGTRKYQCILTDPKSKQVLDILEGREQHILSDYFKQMENRSNVKYFVMDMWKPYKDIAETYFKNATIVIDKYHFIRQVNWALDRVRKEEQKKFSDYRRKSFKRSRFLLLKRMNLLNRDQLDAVDVMLQTSTNLQNAYLLKEKFYEFVDSKDLYEAKKNLQAWYLFVNTCNLKEFNTCANTITNWQKYILNSFTCPYTNGYTEGVNNKIKVLKRNAYGVKNFDRFRNRILHMMN